MVQVRELGATEGGRRVHLDDLEQHIVVLGATGSGKTFAVKRLIQQAVLDGIPCMAFDNQGDFGAFLLNSDPPASAGGEPLNPFSIVRWRTAARRLCVVGEQVGLGTSLGGDTAEEAARQLADLLDMGPKERMSAIYDLMNALESTGTNDFDELLGALPAKSALRRSLSVLRAGSLKRLLDAPPIAFGDLVGLTVLYLGELADRAQEMYFLSRILSGVLPWARDRAVMKPIICAVDECADLVPPIREPNTKRVLTTLLRQGRKYGVCMVLASQSPGDIDYKALSQVKTWLLGRFASKQDIEKVAERLKALCPNQADQVAEDLYRLERGQFYLVTPGKVTKLTVGPLYTPHRPLKPNELTRLAG